MTLYRSAAAPVKAMADNAHAKLMLMLNLANTIKPMYMMSDIQRNLRIPMTKAVFSPIRRNLFLRLFTNLSA